MYNQLWHRLEEYQVLRTLFSQCIYAHLHLHANNLHVSPWLYAIVCLPSFQSFAT